MMFRFLARRLLGMTPVRDVRIVLHPRPDTQLIDVCAANRPSAADYEWSEHFRPTNEVVGDFFAYFPLPDHRIAMIVADVAGHGIPAAVTVQQLSNCAKSHLDRAAPETALANFNEFLINLATDRFVTMLLAVLDPRSHQLTIFNAGHVPPFWRRSNGHVELLGESQVGIPLGIDSDQQYTPFVLTVSPGESIVIVTDGVTEALSSSTERYGIERIRRRVAAAENAEAIVTSIVGDVCQFVAGPVLDALCVLCFERNSESSQDSNRMHLDRQN
jgi:serine phosphatase RsbU (regulator of sigma subunit)